VPEQATSNSAVPAGEASKSPVGIGAASGEGYSEDQESHYDGYSDFETEGESASPNRSDFRDESAREPGLQGFAVDDDNEYDDEEYDDDGPGGDPSEDRSEFSVSRPKSQEASAEATTADPSLALAAAGGVVATEEVLDVRTYVQRLSERAAQQLQAARTTGETAEPAE